QYLAKIFLGLEQRVFRSCFADLQHRGDFGMPETVDFVEQENIALLAAQLGGPSFERDPQGRVSGGSSRLGASRSFIGFFLRDFFFAQAATTLVVAGVDQEPEQPGDETPLAA